MLTRKKNNYLFVFSFVLLINLFTQSCDNSNNNKLNNNSLNNTIMIGTFNIQWLGDGIDDENPRSESEIQEIANRVKSVRVYHSIEPIC